MLEDEIYDDMEVEGSKRFRYLSVLLAALAVGGFVWLAWYAYMIGTSSSASHEVPVVQAEGRDFRSRPEEPGGMEIPHRDKTIYEVIKGNGDRQPKVERLMPKEEEPVQPVKSEPKSVEALFEERKRLMEESTETKAPKIEKKVEAITTQSLDTATQKASEVSAAIADMAADMGVSDTTSKTVDKAATGVVLPKRDSVKKPSSPSVKPLAEQPVQKQNFSATTHKGHRVQLGAFKTPADANAAWNKLYRAQISLLGQKSYVVEKADVKDKGLFYRLQVVPFEDENAARTLCKKLAERGQGCFVVKR